MSDVSAVSEVFLGAGIRSTWLDQFDGTVMEAWDRIEIPQILVAMSMHMGTPPVNVALGLMSMASMVGRDCLECSKCHVSTMSCMVGDRHKAMGRSRSTRACCVLSRVAMTMICGGHTEYSDMADIYDAMDREIQADVASAARMSDRYRSQVKFASMMPIFGRGLTSMDSTLS